MQVGPLPEGVTNHLPQRLAPDRTVPLYFLLEKGKDDHTNR